LHAPFKETLRSEQQEERRKERRRCQGGSVNLFDVLTEGEAEELSRDFCLFLTNTSHTQTTQTTPHR